MGKVKKGRPGGKPAAPNKQAAVQVPVGPEEAKKPLRPSQCRSHLRKTVAEAYRDIVSGFVEQAKAGSCQHLKMATELVESKKGGRASRVKGPAAEFMEELEAQGRV